MNMNADFMTLTKGRLMINQRWGEMRKTIKEKAKMVLDRRRGALRDGGD
jgi:hypothetical protein